MSRVDNSEIWRQIPPEEKFSLISRAHSKGVTGAIIAIAIASTLAIALQNPWWLWGSMIISPFIFQLLAGKAWRDQRPRLVLEYLAARSAARRYAFTANSKDLSVALLFRGHMEQVADNSDEDPMAAMKAELDGQDTDVWIALFRDALVMLSEKAGGAHCEFAQLLGERLVLEAHSMDGGGDYSNRREIMITAQPERGATTPRKYKVTSHAPAALIVFEKQLQAFTREKKLEAQRDAVHLASADQPLIE